MVFYSLTTSVPEYVHISKLPQTKQNKTFSAQSVSHQKSLVLHKLREKMFHPWKYNSKMENKFHTFQIMSCFFFLKKVLYIFSHLSHIKTLEIYMGLARQLRQ